MGPDKALRRAFSLLLCIALLNVYLVGDGKDLSFVLGLICLCLILFLGYGVWKWVLRPLRIIESELGEGYGKTSRGSRAQRIMWHVRELVEEHQRAQIALEANTENMREAEKLALVGKLAAGVAHSIRNPLTGIKLRLFSLSRTLSVNEKQKEHLQAISDAVEHVEKIVSNFLSVSRKPSLEKTLCNISAIVDRALLLLEPRIEAYRIRIERDRRVLPDIEADAEKLCEAFASLIANACDASGMDGFIRITENAGALDSLKRVIVVRIQDSGPGIPEKLREMVFEPFVSTKKEGTGLGLPIAKKIFEEHGGWLTLHCAEGEGASFACVLPFTGKEDVWLRYS